MELKPEPASLRPLWGTAHIEPDLPRTACACPDLISLPDDLIFGILEDADYKTLMSCRQCCRRLRDIIDGYPKLQYTIELASTGMCPGASDGLSAREGVNKLRALRTAWKTSQWSPPGAFSHLAQWSAFDAAVSGNTLVLRKDFSGGIATFMVQRFPSEIRGIPEQHWELKLTFPAYFICADESQDLLIVTSGADIHVLTLSTGQRHPLITASDALDTSGIHSSCKVYVYGNLLAAVPSARSEPRELDTIWIWNWKTARLVTKLCGSFDGSFAFLNTRYVVISCRPAAGGENLSLCVYRIPEDASPDPFEGAAYHFELNVPAWIHSGQVTSYSLGASTAPSNLAGTRPVGRFCTDPSEQLLVLRWESGGMEWWEEDGDMEGWHMLHIPVRALLGYIAAHPAEAGGSWVVSWAGWSQSPACRVTTANPPSLVHGGVCGMHSLLGYFEDGIRVVDCHAGRVAGAVASRTPDLSSARGEDESARAVGRAPDRCGHVPQHYFKDIPSPRELIIGDKFECFVGEDVVVLLERGSDGMFVSRVFCHPL
ncbi:hypothetical protein BC834DRAFT_907059 [Gloeopeniophorella convolvens]|nr:hypothetical protein BC834DRAFT_907059 [Gloeopeniophorella convolvens]